MAWSEMICLEQAKTKNKQKCRLLVSTHQIRDHSFPAELPRLQSGGNYRSTDGAIFDVKTKRLIRRAMC